MRLHVGAGSVLVQKSGRVDDDMRITALDAFYEMDGRESNDIGEVLEWYQGEDAGDLKRSELNELVENWRHLNALEKNIWKINPKIPRDEKSWKTWKSNQKIVMDEKLVQNVVMDEELVEKIVMDEKLVQKIVMDGELIHKTVMDEELVQNVVMDEEFVKNFVMGAKFDPKVVMDLSVLKIVGWNEHCTIQ